MYNFQIVTLYRLFLTDASGAYKAKLKTEEDQSRYHSSPNIAKLMQDEDQKPAQPFVSREIKPQPQSVCSLELQKDRYILEAKVRDFNPIWGSVVSINKF